MYQELGKFVMLSMMVLICLGILSWLAVLHYRIMKRLLLDDIKGLIQTELNKKQEGSH